MTNKINGLEPRPVRIGAGTAVTKTGQRTPETPAREPVSTADTGVRITGAARALAALEQAIRDQPAVDERRVAEIRQRLDDGRYPVDPQRIADRLLRLEEQLARPRGNPGE